VAQQADQIAGSSSAGDAARDWQAVRDAADIQYTPLPPAPVPPEPPEPNTPAWLEQLGEWLRSIFEPLGKALGMSWPVVEKVLLVLAALLALILLWKLVLEPLLAVRRKPNLAVEQEWAPSQAKATALLEDADRLAGEGRYGEAAHLLLQRSVSHIAEARPDWLHPASTAREIASLASLPERARSAFGVIAARVERSLFALRELDASDWQEARAAYADFALQKILA
jgi:hypothetical protein